MSSSEHATERKVVYEEKMKHLQEKLQQMGSLIEEAIARSIEALKKRILNWRERLLRAMI